MAQIQTGLRQSTFYGILVYFLHLAVDPSQLESIIIILIIESYKFMQTTIRRVAMAALITLCMLALALCRQHEQKHHFIDSYLRQGDPLRIEINIKNQTDNLIAQQFTILYSLSQPDTGRTIQLPVYDDMDNLTITASLWSEQNQRKPLFQIERNLTRYAKIRNQAGFGFAMELEGMPQKNDEHSKYGLHIPVRFSVLMLYIEDPLPYIHEYFRMFNFQIATKQNRKLYVAPLDLSQLHVPYKTYKHIHNITNNTHNMTVNVKVYNFKYFQIFYGLTNQQLLKKANPYLAEIYTQQTIDLIKQTLFDNNFYLVVLYFSLSFIQIFMQIFAFKNQIQVWRKIQNKPGLSIQTLYQRLVFQIIICLYLYEKQANKLYLAFQVFDLALTCWKITRAVKISFSKDNKYLISFGYKDWYHRKVESADSEATHYTNYLILVLFLPFIIYKLYPLAHHAYQHYGNVGEVPMPSLRQAYMFFLQSSVMFILVFGFVMMTPQIYINYKLKSVDHLPWKTLIYRFIYTIIDDIFVFMIDLPWLQRMFSFRDDVIFVLYLIQRRIYRVDKNRLALSSGSVNLSQEGKPKEVEEQKHIKSD